MANVIDTEITYSCGGTGAIGRLEERFNTIIREMDGLAARLQSADAATLKRWADVLRACEGDLDIIDDFSRAHDETASISD